MPEIKNLTTRGEGKNKFEMMKDSLLESIFRYMQHGFYIKDNEGNILNLQKPNYLMNIFNKESRKHAIPNEDLIFEGDDKVLKEGRPIINLERSFFDENGFEKIFCIHKFPIFDEQNNILGLIGINLNITDIRRNLNELKTLVNISNGLYSAISFEEIGRTVFDNLIKFNPSIEPAGKLSVYDSEKNLYKTFFIRENNINVASVPLECPLEEVKYYSKLAIENKQTLVIEDNHSEFSLNIDQRQKDMPSGSMIFIPLYHKEKFVGVFSYARSPNKSIDKRFIRFLESVAKYISISVGELLNEEKRKVIEENLRKERNLLRTLIDALPDDLYFKDKEHRFIMVNKTLCDHRELTESDFLYKTDFDLLKHNLAKIFYDEETEILTTGKPQINREFIYRDLNGNTHSEYITKVPIKDENGQIFGLVGINHETTDFVRTMEELQTFLNISKGLNLANTFSDLGKAIFEDAGDFHFIRNSGGKLAVYHEEKDLFEIIYNKTITDIVLHSPNKCKISEVGYFSKIAIDSGKTLFIENNHSEKALTIDPRQKYIVEHSFVLIPLYYQNRFVGLFSFARIGKNSIDQRFINFLESIAKYISISVGELLVEEKRKIDEGMIRRAHGQLKEYSNLVVELQEKERRKISRELHDSVNQILISAKLKISSLADKPLEVIQAENIKIKKMLEDAVIEIRNISHDLHPIILDDLGLKEALRNYIYDFEERTGIEIEYEKFDLPVDPPYKYSINIFRVFQEILNNIEKHSQASGVNLYVDFDMDNIILNIKDNGIGFDPDSIYLQKGSGKMFGLRNIQERINSMNGRINIISRKNEGTEINILIPFLNLVI